MVKLHCRILCLKWFSDSNAFRNSPEYPPFSKIINDSLNTSTQQLLAFLSAISRRDQLYLTDTLASNLERKIYDFF